MNSLRNAHNSFYFTSLNKNRVRIFNIVNVLAYFYRLQKRTVFVLKKAVALCDS